MANIPFQKTNFTAAEISPRLYGRVDFPKYHNGVAEMLNVTAHPHGGCSARPGTRFIAEVSDHAKKHELADFEFNDEQSYGLVLGPNGIEFLKDGGVIWAPNTDGTLTNGTFGSDLAGWTVSSVSWSSGEAAFSAGGYLEQSITVTDPTILHVVRFKVIGTKGTDKLDFQVGSSSGASDILAAATHDVGGHCVEFTPGAGNTTFYIRFTQSVGTPNLDNVHLLDDEPVHVETPYGEDDVSDVQFTQSADVMYLAHGDHAPRKLMRTGHATWSCVEIDFTAEPSSWATDGYPVTADFYDQRLVWARGITFWFSRTADYENFTANDPTEDEDGFTRKIAGRKVNAIQWIAGDSDVLAAATKAGVWVVKPADRDAPLTPDNVTVKKHPRAGGKKSALPVRTEEATLYVDSRGRRVHELAYRWENERWVAPRMDILAEHIGKKTLDRCAYAETPDSVIWFTRGDGVLVGMTYMRDQEVIGFHRHEIGGDGFVESVTTIPGADRDEVYLIVRRTIDGATKRYIELLEGEFERDAANGEGTENAFFLDCGLTYDQPITMTGATQADPVVHPWSTWRAMPNGRAL